MNVENRLKELESWLLCINALPEEVKFKASQQNAWFTYDSIDTAFLGIKDILVSIKEDQVLEKYQFSNKQNNIGLVLAGNIPFVGLHDVLAVILSGGIAHVKLSSQDSVLMIYLFSVLFDSKLNIKNQIKIVEKLEIDTLDAVIATGSNNTARYFQTYFSKVPNIIRKSRSSIGVLKGDESIKELQQLGEDVFTYFGLGCRNVSKIFVPKDYDLTILLDAWSDYDSLMDLSKYANNYTYYKSAFLVNSTEHLDTGYVLLTESSDWVSPLGVLYYERYSSISEVEEKVINNSDQIQCVVGEGGFDLGQAQKPRFIDYADGVDTLSFLSDLP